MVLHLHFLQEIAGETRITHQRNAAHQSVPSLSGIVPGQADLVHEAGTVCRVVRVGCCGACLLQLRIICIGLGLIARYMLWFSGVVVYLLFWFWRSDKLHNYDKFRDRADHPPYSNTRHPAHESCTILWFKPLIISTCVFHFFLFCLSWRIMFEFNHPMCGMILTSINLPFGDTFACIFMSARLCTLGLLVDFGAPWLQLRVKLEV